MARNQNEVRKVSDLPEWFSIDKYAEASQLGFVGWYEQLKVRKSIIRLIELSTKPKITLDVFQAIRELIFELLSEIQEAPLHERGNSPLFENEVGTCHIYDRGVRLITVLDLYMMERSIEEDKRNYVRAWMEAKDSPAVASKVRSSHIECKDWFNYPVDELTSVDVFGYTIRVNPLIPDNVLIDEFKDLLREIRKHGSDYCNSQRPDFNGWIKFGVLPFLDLWMWQCVEDKHIPNRVMADAIFPAGEGGEEVVRKTTRKLAFSLLDEPHLHTLATRAIGEKADRKDH